MVVIDTSVWISFFRGRDHRLVEQLRELLDQDHVGLAVPVRAELFAGAARKHVVELQRVLGALPVYYPERTTWRCIEQWVAEAGARGQRFGIMDCLIAAVTSEHQASLWSLDHDFERMARLGWVDLWTPHTVA